LTAPKVRDPDSHDLDSKESVSIFSVLSKEKEVAEDMERK
jgi:hypothetical protein